MTQSFRVRAAILLIFVNVLGLLAFLISRSPRLLAAVVDPLHPDWGGMERAYAGFTLYAVSLCGALAIGVLVALRAIARRRSRPRTPVVARSRRSLIVSVAALATALTAGVVLVLIEVLLFQDYGIHFYEFDVVGILADAALRRDLGIQPAEVARVTAAAAALIGVETVLGLLALKAAAWRDGALARACAAALCVTAPGGLVLFHAGEADIRSDRSEFVGALPFGRHLLGRTESRPHIAVEPRLGGSGYPVLAPGADAPRLNAPRNVVFFVADGLRADMVRPVLTPNLLQFSARPDVIASQRHYSTGHVSESGIFGLLYGLQGHAFHSYVDARVPAYPIEVLKRNGYDTYLISSSRLNPYPSDQLIKVFDSVSYPRNDDEALEQLRDYVNARRADGRPYFVLAFIYTPHYPFTSAKPQFQRYPLVGKAARTNYMNDVLQADDYFRQVFELVRADFDSGRTVLLATSDHGEEIRDHGRFGHASPTFWNEKIQVPFALGLPGSKLSGAVRRPSLSEHVDVWPTILEFLGVDSAGPRFSDGRSLLRPPPEPDYALVTGRFFPFADRPSVLIDSLHKVWFRVTAVDSSGRLCASVVRVTDLEDQPSEASGRPTLRLLDADFWRFLKPVSRSVKPAC